MNDPEFSTGHHQTTPEVSIMGFYAFGFFTGLTMKTADQIKREIKALVNEAAAQGTLIDSMRFRFMETMVGPASIVDMEVMERIKQ